MTDCPKGMRLIILLIILTLVYSSTIIGLVLFGYFKGYLDSRETNFKKNMECSMYSTSEGTTEICENIGQGGYPYIMVEGSKLCTLNASKEEIERATEFEDTEKVREIFGDNSKFILKSASGLEISYILLMSYWGLFEIYLLTYFFYEVGLPFLFRLYTISHTYYWSFFWAFPSMPYLLAVNIDFGGCIQMRNSYDVYHILDTQEYWIQNMIVGIIFPTIPFILFLCSFPFLKKNALKYFSYILRAVVFISMAVLYYYLIIHFIRIILLTTMDSVSNMGYFWIFVAIMFISRLIVLILPNMINYYFSTINKQISQKLFPGIDYVVVGNNDEVS